MINKFKKLYHRLFLDNFPAGRFSKSKSLSVNEYCDRYFSTYAAPKFIVYPKKFHRETMPKGMLPETSWKFINYSARNIPEAFVLSLQEGRTWGSNGAVITREGVLLRDVSREFGNRATHSFLSRKTQIHPSKIQGTTAIINTCGGDTYYHWLFDILPRIHLIKQAGLLSRIDAFILPEIRFPFQRQSLDLLGITGSRIIETKDESFYIEAEHLIVPSLPSLLGTVNSWATEFLRDTFLGGVLPAVPTGKKIYISRRNSSNRKLGNESEIMVWLQEKGFNVVDAENYSFIEQIAIFNKADLVIAPHGSGLSNIVFCRPGTKVVELFSSGFVVPCFWIVSNSVSLKYYYGLNNQIDQHYFSSYWEGEETDFDFPLQYLKDMLELQ